MQELEALIDSQGLSYVLRMLASICDEKAEHVAVNWQDATTAKVWVHAKAKLELTANELALAYFL